MTPEHTQKKPFPDLVRLNLHGRQLHDLELLLVGGFSPLKGFMNEADYSSVVHTMRLSDGSLFPIPVVLDVPSSYVCHVGDTILLCDQFGNPLARMNIESRYTPEKLVEARKVYGTTDVSHPGVSFLLHEVEDTYIGGEVELIAFPKHADFTQFRKTPDDLKKSFAERGWDTVVGFQTRNPIHRAHFELIHRAHKQTGAPVLVHPVVGMTKPGDIDYVTRIRIYNAICSTYGKDFTELSLLPLAMRMAGPREALWHALIRKNYGCTHFIVGRDHAGPGSDANGNAFYDPDEARLLADAHAPEMNIQILSSEELVYAPARKSYISVKEVLKEEKIENLSGTEFRRRLTTGEAIPDWFSFPESIAILKEHARKDPRPGIALFFTGLPSAGKTTIAQLLESRLQELQDRQITFLDGDVVREHLSKGLGFSKEDRDTNVARIGYVASEVVRHGGIVICAVIAPYASSRARARTMVEQHGRFLEVYINTPVEVCEKRDPKGLYTKARKGIIAGFTGVTDPYEAPIHPELEIATTTLDPEAAVSKIIDYLQDNNLL